LPHLPPCRPFRRRSLYPADNSRSAVAAGNRSSCPHLSHSKIDRVQATSAVPRASNECCRRAHSIELLFDNLIGLCEDGQRYGHVLDVGRLAACLAMRASTLWLCPRSSTAIPRSLLRAVQVRWRLAARADNDITCSSAHNIHVAPRYQRSPASRSVATFTCSGALSLSTVPRTAAAFIGGIGAWELSARYSATNLNSNVVPGMNQSVTGGINGGLPTDCWPRAQLIPERLGSDVFARPVHQCEQAEFSGDGPNRPTFLRPCRLGPGGPFEIAPGLRQLADDIGRPGRSPSRRLRVAKGELSSLCNAIALASDFNVQTSAPYYRAAAARTRRLQAESQGED
jgi:hypothetical protein